MFRMRAGPPMRGIWWADEVAGELFTQPRRPRVTGGWGQGIATRHSQGRFFQDPHSPRKLRMTGWQVGRQMRGGMGFAGTT